MCYGMAEWRAQLKKGEMFRQRDGAKKGKESNLFLLLAHVEGPKLGGGVVMEIGEVVRCRSQCCQSYM